MNLQARLQQTLHTEIPITQAMEISVHSYANGCLQLAAPLAPNINHKDTAFAGSVNAVVTLAGWSLIWCVLDQAALPGIIVIQDSTIQYLRPITSDFVATCCLPTAGDITRFLAVLRRKGRARLALQAEIWDAQQIAVRFTGRYVVQQAMAAQDQSID